ncbi:mammalian cell entry protein [Mycobacterium branderi]|uniref:Mce protein n=1 Tax=Mycobacterium branderi TaxID=43348 RepID=A0ABM7KVK2_9MYCO|nr:mammalian cell entry protein [Mycobacterium branderi]MCV7236327.1 mammalian cell entry protein [Mycobacterium branderi]BBZ15212.1 hypothetical protein MBRA_54070 [Mycobacterium branderi]
MAVDADTSYGPLTVLVESDVDCTDTGSDIDPNSRASVPDPAEAEACVDEQSALRATSEVRSAVTLGAAMVVVLAVVVGWLGFRFYQSHRDQARDALLLQAARQGALNLTTISYTEADSDVQRILDSSTGEFYDDFQRRSQSFIDVVKKAQSKSEGTVTAAGLESVQSDEAKVLATISVKTSNAGAAEQQPRL